jgi:hypothetical protein
MKGGPGVGGTSSGFNSPASSNSGTSLHNHSSSTTAEGWQVTGIHTSILGMALLYIAFLQFKPVFQIRIRIGPGFNQVSGSGFRIRIRSQEVKNDPQK